MLVESPSYLAALQIFDSHEAEYAVVGLDEEGMDAAAAAARSTNGRKPVWTIPTEAEVAASLETKYLEAVKDFVKLKKNDELMFCKRWREIGTSIAKINCLTAA